MKKTKPIRIEGDIAYITLTQGYFATIDVCDISLIDGVSWYIHRQKHTVYARANEVNNRSTVYMHRLIMGVSSGVEVDHKDGDGLNNRRSNLRVATRSQNNQNRTWSKTSSSGMKGVGPHKATGKWHARIQANGVIKYLGLFETPEKAKEAYEIQAANLHAEYARK